MNETMTPNRRGWLAVLLLSALGLVLAAGPSAAAPAGSPWGGNFFPNIVLVNQDGKKLRFYDDMIKGKVVMINFVYAGCKDACPLETAKLRQVQESLGDRVGREIFMYSITIDPKHDTPARLKDYAQRYKVAPGWQFLTGKESEINQLRQKLGLLEEGEGRGDHTMNLIVGNEATGQWKQRSTFDNPKVLARVLGDELFNFRRPAVADGSYAEASHQISINPGEDLFRRRCQVCHTVGAGDTLGPDLAGVTRNRDRNWLVRWLKTPDQVLAEKDPIAQSLFARYNQVIMPNLRLSDRDVAVLIQYLDAESDKLQQRGSHEAQHSVSAEGS